MNKASIGPQTARHYTALCQQYQPDFHADSGQFVELFTKLLPLI